MPGRVEITDISRPDPSFFLFSFDLSDEKPIPELLKHWQIQTTAGLWCSPHADRYVRDQEEFLV